jgi:hypothetical protein
VLAAYQGWRDVAGTELKAAQNELHKHLASVLAQIRVHFLGGGGTDGAPSHPHVAGRVLANITGEKASVARAQRAVFDRSGNPRKNRPGLGHATA